MYWFLAHTTIVEYLGETIVSLQRAWYQRCTNWYMSPTIDIYHLLYNCEKYPLFPLKPMCWRSLNNAHQTFLAPCIRCIDNPYDSCGLSDINRILSRHCSRWFQNVDLLWRHRYMCRPLAIVMPQWQILLFPRGCYGRFLITMALGSVLEGICKIYVCAKFFKFNYRKKMRIRKLIGKWRHN